MTRSEYLVALISATPVAIPPAIDAMAEQFPEAEVWNLLDDRLLRDAADAGGLTEPLHQRMRRLIAHAVDCGADAVLLTCSMYGPVVQQAAASVPVLAPDDAAFEAAATGGYSRVLVVASLDSALADSVDRFTQRIEAGPDHVEVRGLVVPTALDAEGPTELAEALITACQGAADDADAVLLAQFSLAPAQQALADALGKPVIAGPHSAAAALRETLTQRPQRAPVGAIADDYTGATDVALAFRAAGLRTVLFFGSPSADVELPPHDAVVIALKSRTVAAAEAVEVSLKAREWLAAAGVGQVYFKYCSTFDSTPRGNIGPVMDALAAATSATSVITTPSSPEHRRTVYAGQLFVDGIPLAESHMAHHPLTPMTDSSVPRLLAAQTGHRVEPLPLATVREGVAAVRRAVHEAREHPTVYFVADAVEPSDLDVVAAAVIDEPLVAGAAGLAGAVARLHGNQRGRPDGEASVADPVGSVHAAVLSGSCSARTLEQIADFTSRGNPSFRLDALSTPSAEKLAEGALDWIDGLPAGSTPLVYSSLPAPELRQVQQQLGAAESAELLESAMSLIATGLARRGFRRIVSAGGETSGAIVEALQIRGVEVGADVAPGVPWVYTIGAEPLALLLKSGNFGDVSLFSRALDPDQHWGVQA